MQTVTINVDSLSLDSLVVERLQKCAEDLADIIRKDIDRTADAENPTTYYMDIEESLNTLRNMNGVLEYLGGDPVDWTGYINKL